VGQERERERDPEADADRDDGQEDVLEQRRPVLVDVVDDPVGAEAVLGDAARAGALADLELGEERGTTPRRR
jgi:hypothetical protein